MQKDEPWNKSNEEQVNQNTNHQCYPATRMDKKRKKLSKMAAAGGGQLETPTPLLVDHKCMKEQS